MCETKKLLLKIKSKDVNFVWKRETLGLERLVAAPPFIDGDQVKEPGTSRKRLSRLKRRHFKPRPREGTLISALVWQINWTGPNICSGGGTSSLELGRWGLAFSVDSSLSVFETADSKKPCFTCKSNRKETKRNFGFRVHRVYVWVLFVAFVQLSSVVLYFLYSTRMSCAWRQKLVTSRRQILMQWRQKLASLSVVKAMCRHF